MIFVSKPTSGVSIAHSISSPIVRTLLICLLDAIKTHLLHVQSLQSLCKSPLEHGLSHDRENRQPFSCCHLLSVFLLSLRSV
ncbi:hypothetical protein BC01_088 [Bacillus phage BC01]|nr:hypothetical protein BC01_088 [Bacillus phage BC01]